MIELKVGKFNSYNAGQLNTYLNYYRSMIMEHNDNPPVGILLVTNKNDTLVEFAIAGMDNQLFVSKYMVELPDSEQLKKLIQAQVCRWKN